MSAIHLCAFYLPCMSTLLVYSSIGDTIVYESIWRGQLELAVFELPVFDLVYCCCTAVQRAEGRAPGVITAVMCLGSALVEPPRGVHWSLYQRCCHSHQSTGWCCGSRMRPDAAAAESGPGARLSPSLCACVCCC